MMPSIERLPEEQPHPTVHNFRDLTGMLFGRLEALFYAGRVNGKPSWACKCECGTLTVTVTKQLLRGLTRSCGCLQVDRSKEVNTIHGMRKTVVYKRWQGIMTRCMNGNSKDFARYGGIGRGICKRWRSFENFLEDMGEPPSREHTIERVDNNRGYEPGNCVWVLSHQQNRNRLDNVVVEVNGVKLIAVDWDRKLGRYRGTTAKRIRKGWSPKDAVEIPIMKCFSRNQKK